MNNRLRGPLSGHKWASDEKTNAHYSVIAIKVEFRVLGKYLFRSNDGSYFIRRMKVDNMQLLSVTFPGDFVHLHAGPKLESHNRPFKGRHYHSRHSAHTNMPDFRFGSIATV
ncbi:hypothetical protein M2427_002721 [Bradyrhizobium sp. BR13661]|nr:hypothetical protein [Bradyrhizobium sp. BR13661]